MSDRSLEYIENLEQCIENYEVLCKEQGRLKNELAKVTELKNTLYKQYGHKYVIIQQAEVRAYSDAELAEVKKELLDTSILTILKRFLGIGKKQEEIYAELMGKIRGLTYYLQEKNGNQTEEMEKAKTVLAQEAGMVRTNYRKMKALAEYSKEEENGKEVRNNLYFGEIDVFLESDRKYSEPIIKENLGECYRDDFVKVPYTRNYEMPFQFFFEYEDEKTQGKVNGLTRSLIYQMLQRMSEYEIEFHLIDGANTGNDFSELLGLKQVRAGDVIELNMAVSKGMYKCAQVYLGKQDISTGLKELDGYLGTVAEETAGFANVLEYNQSDTGKKKGHIPLQVVVIQNFPSGFNDADMELLAKLIKNGEQRGISVILQYDRKNKKIFEEKINTVTNRIMDGIHIEAQGEFLTAGDYSSAIALQSIDSGDRDFIQGIVDERNQIKEVDNRFEALLSVDGPFGTMDAGNGISIPFALDRKGEVRAFTLAQALNAHGLVSGGTGSGKSTMLHMIVSSVCMNYTPDDVELWLVDYKITEFSSYKYNTPPHITFLGLSKGIDFTYALLEKIYTEYERRQQLIKNADTEAKLQGRNVNITSINDYREYFGKNSMSRLLVIVDEFHVMAQQVNEDPKYKEMLENILAEGRAMGITLLLSDQSVTVGLKGLTEKGKKQIKCRLAMANDEEEMKEMLQTRESEVIKPFLNLKTGECVMITHEMVRNESGNMEERKKFEKVQNIFINGETRFLLSQNIRKYYGAEAYMPVYMDETEQKFYSDNEINQWILKNQKKENYERQLYLYLGEAMNLTGCFQVTLLRRRSENIMSVGGSEEEQMQLILAAIHSFMRIPGSRVVVFTDPYCSLFNIYEDNLNKLQDKHSSLEIYSDIADVCDVLNELLDAAGDKTSDNKVLVVWLGLDDMYEEFETYPEKPRQQHEGRTRKSTKKGESLASISSRLDDKWAMFFDEDFSEAGSQEEEYADDEDEDMVSDGEPYNAVEDIVTLLHVGPRNGIFNYVVYDNVYPIRNHRQIKVDDFKHKLAFSMGRDDCGEYLGRTTLLDGMGGQKDVAAYYDGKISVKKFVTYQFKE